jgi:integrase
MEKELNQSTVAKLVKDAVPASGNVIIWDTRLGGFGLRITAGGVASFVLNYRTVEGKERRYTIGRWPDWKAQAAYDEAVERKKEIKNGADPLATKSAEAIVNEHAERTLADAARDYLKNYAEKSKRPSSVRDDRAMLDGVILPRLGSMPLSEIRTEHIEKLHSDLKATPIRANRILSLLSTLFNRVIASDEEAAEHYGGGEQIRWITINPTKRVERYPENKRQVWLDKDQLGALKQALDSYSSQDAADAIRLLVLTGSREMELLSARWDEFDLKRGIWTKPSHHTKQKKIETLPLGDKALGILRRMAKTKTSEFLFPGQQASEQADGESHRGYLKWAWMQICKNAGLAKEYKVAGKGKYAHKQFSRWKPLVRVHDLRHSFASNLASNGESLPMIGGVLGHTQPKTTDRYSHLAGIAKKKTMDHFAEIIEW